MGLAYISLPELIHGKILPNLFARVHPIPLRAFDNGKNMTRFSGGNRFQIGRQQVINLFGRLDASPVINAMQIVNIR